MYGCICAPHIICLLHQSFRNYIYTHCQRSDTSVQLLPLVSNPEVTGDECHIWQSMPNKQATLTLTTAGGRTHTGKPVQPNVPSTIWRLDNGGSRSKNQPCDTVIIRPLQTDHNICLTAQCCCKGVGSGVMSWELKQKTVR